MTMEKDPGCIVQRDMLPTVVGYRFLREWLVLAEEFVNERKDWNNRTLAAILGCTLQGEVHDEFRALTNNGDVEGWSDVWAKMAEIENEKGAFAYLAFTEPQTVKLECPDCHCKFEQLESYEKHRADEHNDLGRDRDDDEEEEEGVEVDDEVEDEVDEEVDVVDEEVERDEVEGEEELHHQEQEQDQAHDQQQSHVQSQNELHHEPHHQDPMDEDRPEESWVKDFEDVEQKEAQT